MKANGEREREYVCVCVCVCVCVRYSSMIVVFQNEKKVMKGER